MAGRPRHPDPKPTGISFPIRPREPHLQNMTDESPQTRKRLISGVGMILGLIALATAFLSPTIAEAIDPPAPPIEEVTVDLATRLIDAAKAKAAGKEYEAAVASPKLPSQFLYPLVIGLGMIAAAFGIAALIRSEDRTMAGGAIALGIGAAVIQWSMMIVGAILLVLLVIAVIGFLTGGGI